MIQQALANAQEIVKECPPGQDIDSVYAARVDELASAKYETAVKVHQKQRGKPVVYIERKITMMTTEKSIYLMDYFIFQKKALAGYGDPLSVRPTNTTQKSPMCVFTKILLSPGDTAISSDLIRHIKGTNTEIILTHFTTLQEEGLGQVQECKPSKGGRSYYKFAKIQTSGLSPEELVSLTDRLGKYQVKLAEYEVGLDLSPQKKPKSRPLADVTNTNTASCTSPKRKASQESTTESPEKVTKMEGQFT